MTNYILPESVGYQEVHDKMKQRGFVVYPGKGALEGKIIHIANLGILNEEDILKICRNMKEVIEEIIR
jgi:2-aminoethylphosphonate-pyruvate transaminase